MVSGSSELVEIVVCYRGRRRHGRSRTPAVRPRRPASLQGGASALPQPIQQTPIQLTAVAGHSLSDALRGPDLSRSRSAAGRASRIAPSAGTGERARLHHPVPLPATAGRRNHRPGGRRDGAPFAETAAVEALAEVGGRGDLDQQFLLSQIARRGPWNDCANLPAVVAAASERTPIGLVLADAEFDSERNHTYIRRELGAQSVIPAKRGKKTWRIHGVRAQMRRAFPRRLYRRRALIESLFSSVKRKLSARAPGRSLRTQMRQALLLGLSFNLYRLRHRYLFSRMSTEPTHLINALSPRSLILTVSLLWFNFRIARQPRAIAIASDQPTYRYRSREDVGCLCKTIFINVLVWQCCLPQAAQR